MTNFGIILIPRLLFILYCFPGVSIVREPATSSHTSSTVAPPPPLNCWNDNRAKFSDVVARNQEYSKRYDESKHCYMKENKDYTPHSRNFTLSTTSSQDSPTYFTELFYPDDTFQDATYTDFTYPDENYKDHAFNKKHNGETSDKIFGNDAFQPVVNEDLVFVNSYYDPGVGIYLFILFFQFLEYTEKYIFFHFTV